LSTDGSDAPAAPASAPPARPLPDTRNAGRKYWRAAADGVLLIPKCNACVRTHWHPRPRCPHCGSADIGWIESAGRGEIHTFTIVRQSGEPYFKSNVPYAGAMVDIDGVRMMTNIVETPLESLRIGMPVEVMFEPAQPDIAIPLFRAAKKGSGSISEKGSGSISGSESISPGPMSRSDGASG
jgi:uncharacterized OB-fold protein